MAHGGLIHRPCSSALRLVLALLAMGIHLTACQGPSSPAASSASATPSVSEVPGRIVGTVTLEAEKNAGGVQVYVPGSQHLALTDDQGRFTLDALTPGPYRVMARAEAHETQLVGEVTVDRSAVLKEYSLTSVTLKLKSQANTAAPANALGSLGGKVTLAAGAGAIDWSRCVAQLDGTPFRTVCGADGSFLLWSLPPDDYKLRISLDGFDPVSVPVRVFPGRPTNAPAIEIKPAGTGGPSAAGGRRILGTVELTAADGTPSNAFDKVTVGIVGQPASNTPLSADGSFTLDKLKAEKYQVSAWGTGFGSAPPLEVDLTSEPQMEIQLTLTATGPTTGTAAAGGATLHGVALKNVDGLSDMSGISVALAGTSRVAITDADGKYSITGVAPGNYQVVAQAAGFKRAQLGPVAVAAGADVEAQGLMLEPDLAYPVVLATTPQDGARNVTIKREIPITVRFNKKMTPESLRQAVRIEPAVNFRIYAGKEALDTDYDLMKIVLIGAGAKPVAAFDTSYKITIGTAARDFEGLALQKPYELALRTGKPSVIGTFPDEGGVLQDDLPGRPVVIYFNAPMDHTSLTADALRVQSTQLQTPSISISDDAESGWTSMSIVTVWSPGQKYQIVLSRRARTAGQTPLSNTPYTFNFRIAARTPITLPTLRDSGSR